MRAISLIGKSAHWPVKSVTGRGIGELQNETNKQARIGGAGRRAGRPIVAAGHRGGNGCEPSAAGRLTTAGLTRGESGSPGLRGDLPSDLIELCSRLDNFRRQALQPQPILTTLAILDRFADVQAGLAGIELIRPVRQFVDQIGRVKVQPFPPIRRRRCRPGRVPARRIQVGSGGRVVPRVDAVPMSIGEAGRIAGGRRIGDVLDPAERLNLPAERFELGGAGRFGRRRRGDGHVRGDRLISRMMLISLASKRYNSGPGGPIVTLPTIDPPSAATRNAAARRF